MKDKQTGTKNTVLNNEELLQSIMTFAREFKAHSRGFGSNRLKQSGAVLLFSGGSGTRKTMAAELLAKQLGKPLKRIDLSGIISKYIGETEKNLNRILSEAEKSDYILLFDEADALFGKRSQVRDAHDRYANQAVSFLLTKLESYNGLAILSTNLKTKIDSAFLRRIHSVIKFPCFGDDEEE